VTMQIRVLGPGCPSCQHLFETTRMAVDELGLDANVEIGHDIAEMISYGVMGSPLLIVDNEVALAGRVLPKRRMKNLLTDLLDAKTEARRAGEAT